MRHITRTVLTVATLLSLATSPMAWAQSAEEVYKKGQTAYSEGQMQQALEFFHETTRLDPNFTDAYFNLGAIYFKQNRYPEALEAFQSLLKIDPNDYQARFETGRLYALLGRPEEAIASFEMIEKTSSRYGRAQAYITQIREKKTAQTTIATTQPETQTTVAATDTTKKPTPLTVKPDPLITALASQAKVSEFASGFYGPTGMAMDTRGVLYVANFSKNTITKIAPNGEKQVLAAGAGINGPVGMSIDTQTGDLYIANHLDNTVAKVTPDGKVSVVATGLKKPYNLYLDQSNKMLYVSQQENNSIARVKL